MKTRDMVLIAAAGIGLYALFANKQTNARMTPETTPFKESIPFTNPIMNQTVTPSGNVVTENIASAKDGVTYINKMYGGTSVPHIDTVVPNTPENKNLSSSFRTSLDKNLLLEKREGGGYKVIGARNIVLTPPSGY
jgi:hypothetical protein